MKASYMALLDAEPISRYIDLYVSVTVVIDAPPLRMC